MTSRRDIQYKGGVYDEQKSWLKSCWIFLGGKDNVLANAACMTRLRVTVKDAGNVDTEGIKALDGVMGLVEDDTMQIVLGPGKVNKVLEEFSSSPALRKALPTRAWLTLRPRTRPRRRPSTSPSRFRPSSRRFPMSSSPASRHHCGWPHQRYLQRH